MASPRIEAAAELLGCRPWKVVLASASPRRRRLLDGLGVEFEVRPAHVAEDLQPGESPEEGAKRLAETKARAVAASGNREAVIGADTLVVAAGRALGKPTDRFEARTMLEELSGRRHRVVTGVALVSGDTGAGVSDVESTEVEFEPLDELTLDALLDSGDWEGKAGAYGVQSLASLVIPAVRGDYFNVVGLPLNRLRRLFMELRALEFGENAARP